MLVIVAAAGAGGGGDGGSGGWWIGLVLMAVIFGIGVWRIATGDSPQEDYASKHDLVPREQQLDPRTGRPRNG